MPRTRVFEWYEQLKDSMEEVEDEDRSVMKMCRKSKMFLSLTDDWVRN